MNRQTIIEEIEQLRKQKPVDIYSKEAKELWDKTHTLSSLLSDMEAMNNCDDELIQIYEMKNQIKSLEEKIKEKENEMFAKKGFKKDVKFYDKRNDKTCLMVNERHYRILKKDGTISAKDSLKCLSPFSIPSFEIIS